MKDISYYKTKLEEEKAALQKELGTVGRVNPDNPKDWEATPPEGDGPEPDANDAADRIEGYEENTGILKQLEIRYNEVVAALTKIEKGEKYGICEVSGEEIEEERLDANPAATTCMKHMKQ